jgi:hypothetical protein
MFFVMQAGFMADRDLLRHVLHLSEKLFKQVNNFLSFSGVLDLPSFSDPSVGRLFRAQLCCDHSLPLAQIWSHRRK